MSSGDPNCGLCQAQFHERWSSLPEVKDHAEDGCPYCQNMLEGLLYLIPDLETRFGHDASFRFQHRRDMSVYADPNGSLRDTKRNEPVKLQYRWFMVDEAQPYEPVGDTASEQSFEKVHYWIQECLSNHKLCGPDEPSPLPTRILDLGEASEEPEGDGGEPEIRLIESSGQRERYIALSHSWGGEQPLTTTAATLEQHKSGIPTANLPTTFRDAAHIARRLGIRYLWIDSLCIIQDSPQDWQLEAARMAGIYRNSWLTVYATASSSPSSGIFRRRQAVWIAADDPEDADTLDALFPAAARLRQDLRLSLRFAAIHPDFGPYAEPARQQSSLPLLTRAWAYQERLLAPRVLHFGPQELLWECTQDLDCECGVAKWRAAPHMGSYAGRTSNAAGELPPKVSHYAALHVAAKTMSKISQARRREKLLSRWEEMVSEYARRALTFPSDRLPAFSGVAGEMADALGMRYRAGQWEETLLPAGLLYERDNCTDLARLKVDDARPAPTWSWASVDAPVRFQIPLAGQPEWANPTVHAQVLEVRCIPSGADERGCVDAGESYVMLSAELVEASLCFEPDPHATPYKSWMYIRTAAAKGVGGPPLKRLGKGSFMVRVGRTEPLAFVPDVRLCDEEGRWLWEGEEPVWCAKILESKECFYWLVLRRSAVDDTAYERIGVVEHPDAKWESKDGEKIFKML